MLALTEDLYHLFENGQILVDLLPVRSQYAPRLDFSYIWAFKGQLKWSEMEMEDRANDLNFLGFQNLYQYWL